MSDYHSFQETADLDGVAVPVPAKPAGLARDAENSRRAPPRQDAERGRPTRAETT